jgi:hypothetical protein
MSGPITAALLGGLILITAVGVPAWARSEADEAQLETVSKDIDQSAAASVQTNKIQTLSKQFNVEPSVVENLRAKKQGWGETTIELAMAQRLMQSDATTYPTMADALNKIATLRGDKMGWGKIAKDLGFKLGPVVSDAMHTRNELRKDVRVDKPLRSETSGKVEKMEKADWAGRPERGGRLERPARPEKVERVH